MIKFGSNTRKQLLQLAEESQVYLEGNVLKVIDAEGDQEFEVYLRDSIEKDKQSRKRRLEVTKQIQSKNKELEVAQKENDRVNRQLTRALDEAEVSKNEAIKAKEVAEELMITSKTRHRNLMEEAQAARVEAEKAKVEAEKAKDDAIKAKEVALNDLDVLQKRSQTALIGKIVKVALWVILGVGITTTAVYLAAMFSNKNVAVLESTWTNIIGILLTNSFSIVGTIMGVKYASENKSE